MESQQIFSKRLAQLLFEKGISQGEFADAIGCTRQSINFYILGKRNPDISLAGNMAKYLGVSCDYLIGFSDIREDIIAGMTSNQLGLSDDTAKFFFGLQALAMGKVDSIKDDYEKLGFYYDTDILPYTMEYAADTLKIVNDLISNDRFGILIQYIKRYKDIVAGKDTVAILENFMLELESPLTGKVYGGRKENIEMMKEFCLHITTKYFDEIVSEIVSDNRDGFHKNNAQPAGARQACPL